MSTPYCAAVAYNTFLKPYLDISDENLLTIFRAPHDVVLGAKDCPGILAVSAVCSDFYVMNLLHV
jgi:hypothetical protein